MASFRVVYDTCVLVPAPLRDLLLRVAEAGLVRAGMSDDILDELERVLVRDFEVPATSAARLRTAVERTFEDSVIEGERYRDMVGLADLPDPDDEHVLAAARSVGAQAIVTMNLKDFPTKMVDRFDVEVLHPDDFLLDLVDLFPVKVARIVEEQAAMLRNPPKTYEEVLDALARNVPATVARLREL
jgi:predicted nucleic acid-binding protein